MSSVLWCDSLRHLKIIRNFSMRGLCTGEIIFENPSCKYLTHRLETAALELYWLKTLVLTSTCLYLTGNG